jgi:hypothetical protein
VRQQDRNAPRIDLFKAGLLTLSLLLPAAAGAGDLPAFRKGMWEFNRTVEGQDAGGKAATLTNKKCTDPSADMKRMNELLAKQGCKFSTPTSRGNVHTFTSECQIQGVAAKSRSVITVESDSAYTVQVDGTAGGRATKELLVARRVGDC